jgi:hypothetical protein
VLLTEFPIKKPFSRSRWPSDDTGFAEETEAAGAVSGEEVLFVKFDEL